MTNDTNTKRQIIVTFEVTDGTTQDELLEWINSSIQDRERSVEVVDIEENGEELGKIKIATTECFRVKRGR